MDKTNTLLAAVGLTLLSSACGDDLAQTVSVALKGVPTLTLAEAAKGEYEAFALSEGDVRLEHMGHHTWTHHYYPTTQRFVVPILPASGDKERPLFFGCRGENKDVERVRSRCTETFRKEPRTLRRTDLVYKGALTKAQAKLGVTANMDAPVYERAETPRQDALVELAPFPVGLLLLILLVAVRPIRERILKAAGA